MRHAFFTSLLVPNPNPNPNPSTLLQEIEIRIPCVVSQVAQDFELSRLLNVHSLPQEHVCAFHRTAVYTVVMAVEKSWQKLDLSVPRRLGNPLAGRGHHVGGDLGD